MFAEKLDLLLAVRERERVTWAGGHRAPLEDRGVYPRPLQDLLPVWVAVGGRGEHDRGSRHGEVRPMVLPYAEHVEPDLVGELDLLEQVAEALGRSDDPPRVRVGRQLGEGVDPELEVISLHAQENANSCAQPCASTTV